MSEVWLSQESFHPKEIKVKVKCNANKMLQLSIAVFYYYSDFFLSVMCELQAPLIAQLVKNPPVMQETPNQFFSQEDLLEKG